MVLACQQARDGRRLPLYIVDSLPKNGRLDIFYNAVILQLELLCLLQKVQLLAHLVAPHLIRSDAAADLACRLHERVNGITETPSTILR